jgi:hypothetical protein
MMRFHRLALAILGACVLPTCQRIDDTDLVIGGLVVVPSRAVPFAITAESPLALSDDWLVYVADEDASGQDLNRDGDATDGVAVVVDLDSGATQTLRAARLVHLLEDEVYLVTDEAEDAFDWDGDGRTDSLVLLHWSRTRARVSLVAPIEDAAPVWVGDRLFFTRAQPIVTGLPGETKVHYVSRAQPRASTAVLAVGADFSPDARPIGQEDGLLWLVQDEHPLLRDLNGDGDSVDETVLALVDGTAPTPQLFNVGLTLGDDPAVRARATTSGDWLVGFLVDEATQGRATLNDPADYPLGLWPGTCTGSGDDDVEDRVLFGLFFRKWSTNPLLFPPFATGITSRGRVLILEGEDRARHVLAGVSHEEDEGTCALNDDGDQADRVLRWVEVDALGPLGPVEPARPVALADLPGGANGVAEVEDRFVAALSEAEDGRDLDGDPSSTDVLTAWVDPFAATGTWRVVLRSGGAPVALDWLAETDDRSAALLGTLERQLGAPCNQDDRDLDDTFAARARFDALDRQRFTWSSRCFATSGGNAGMVVAGEVVFLRADEAAQGRDIDEDGDLDDQILVRYSLESGARLLYVGPLNDLEAPAVTVAGDRAVFRVDERQLGRDQNGDGDAQDLVLRVVPVR